MIDSLLEAVRIRDLCQDEDANCETCPYGPGQCSCIEQALDDLVSAHLQLMASKCPETDDAAHTETDDAAHTETDDAAHPEKKKAQLWDAIFPAILQCASGDSGLHINQLYEAYMRGIKYTDDLICSMSKLLVRAAESHVYSHGTALVCEIVKILVGEVFENQKEEE